MDDDADSLGGDTQVTAHGLGSLCTEAADCASMPPSPPPVIRQVEAELELIRTRSLPRQSRVKRLSLTHAAIQHFAKRERGITRPSSIYTIPRIRQAEFQYRV